MPLDIRHITLIFSLSFVAAVLCVVIVVIVQDQSIFPLGEKESKAQQSLQSQGTALSRLVLPSFLCVCFICLAVFSSSLQASL